MLQSYLMTLLPLVSILCLQSFVSSCLRQSLVNYQRNKTNVDLCRCFKEYRCNLSCPCNQVCRWNHDHLMKTLYPDYYHNSTVPPYNPVDPLLFTTLDVFSSIKWLFEVVSENSYISKLIWTYTEDYNNNKAYTNEVNAERSNKKRTKSYRLGTPVIAESKFGERYVSWVYRFFALPGKDCRSSKVIKYLQPMDYNCYRQHEETVQSNVSSTMTTFCQSVTDFRQLLTSLTLAKIVVDISKLGISESDLKEQGTINLIPHMDEVETAPIRVKSTKCQHLPNLDGKVVSLQYVNMTTGDTTNQIQQITTKFENDQYYLYNCPPDSPIYYDKNSKSCQNTVKNIHFRFFWDGSGIKNVDVDVILGPTLVTVSDKHLDADSIREVLSVQINQHFSVEWVSTAHRVRTEGEIGADYPTTTVLNSTTFATFGHFSSPVTRHAQSIKVLTVPNTINGYMRGDPINLGLALVPTSSSGSVIFAYYASALNEALEKSNEPIPLSDVAEFIRKHQRYFSIISPLPAFPPRNPNEFQPGECFSREEINRRFVASTIPVKFLQSVTSSCLYRTHLHEGKLAPGGCPRAYQDIRAIFLIFQRNFADDSLSASSPGGTTFAATPTARPDYEEDWAPVFESLDGKRMRGSKGFQEREYDGNVLFDGIGCSRIITGLTYTIIYKRVNYIKERTYSISGVMKTYHAPRDVQFSCLSTSGCETVTDEENVQMSVGIPIVINVKYKYVEEVHFELMWYQEWWKGFVGFWSRGQMRFVGFVSKYARLPTQKSALQSEKMSEDL